MKSVQPMLPALVVLASALAMASVVATAQSAIDVLDAISTNYSETMDVSRGTTDGKYLYVPDGNDIVVFDVSDLSSLVEVCRTAPGAGLTAGKKIQFDATDGFLYVLEGVAPSDPVLRVFDATIPGAITEVYASVLETHGAAASFADGTGYPLAIEAANNLLFCAVPAPYGEDFGHRLHVFSIRHRASPVFLSGLVRRSSDREPFALDQNVSKIIYRDGFVYWIIGFRSAIVLDVSVPERPEWSNSFDSTPPPGASPEKGADSLLFQDMSLSRDRIFLTRKFISKKHPIEFHYYEEWDVGNPEEMGATRVLKAPSVTMDYPWHIVPHGNLLYFLTPRPEVPDNLRAYDMNLSFLTGGVAPGPSPLPWLSSSPHISLGQRGLILRGGVTSYSLPGAGVPGLALEETLYEVSALGGDVEVPIRSANQRPLKWFLHDDPMERDWCQAIWRDWGEEGESAFVRVTKNKSNRTRYATMTLYAPGGSSSPRNFHIFQRAPKNGALTVTPSAAEVGANRWLLTAKVGTTTGVEVGWRFYTEAPWITLPEVRNRFGTDTVEIVATPNLTLAARTAEIVFIAPDLTHSQTTLTLSQTGRISVDDVDAAYIQAIINGILDGSKEPKLDVNGDGTLDTVDLQLAINAALGVG